MLFQIVLSSISLMGFLVSAKLFLFNKINSTFLIAIMVIFNLIFVISSYNLMVKIPSKRGKVIFTLLCVLINISIALGLVIFRDEIIDVSVLNNKRWNSVFNYLRNICFTFGVLSVVNCLQEMKKEKSVQNK